MKSSILKEETPGNFTEVSTFRFASVINCAYDPNDKLVYPQRNPEDGFEVNYTLFDEPLLYTIRFQNTGTDTAFNIVIRDQLSTDLDWTTFEPGSASHPYEATLHEDGLLEFHFRNILLPDSIVNEPASHGFVNFTINVKEGVDENTAIQNSAGIYFDFNPPIITNTVENVLVTEFPLPITSFTWTTNNLEFSFEDLSQNNPDSWIWSFGDGNTSMDQNPTYTYAAPGTYEVCLIATNSLGNDTLCQNVNALLAPVADFSFFTSSDLTLNFTDESVNDPIEWLWDFGDGSTSTDQNPFHVYAMPGTYEVCLTVTNAGGMDTTCKTILIETTSVSEPTWAKQIQLLPNPVEDHLSVLFQELPDGNVELNIKSALGQTIGNAKSVSRLTNRLETNQLSSGVYFLEIRKGEELVKAIRFVKQ